MYCNNCGKLLKQNDRFCDECGAKVFEPQTKVAARIDEPKTEVQAEPQVEVQKPLITDMPTPKNNWLNTLSLCGFIFAAVGVGIFLIIVFVGLIGWGRVYLFDGYVFTRVFVVIAIILMILGSIILLTKLILMHATKLNGFPHNKATKIVSIVLVVLTVVFSIWGFVDAGETSSSHAPTYRPSKLSLHDAYTIAGCSSPWATYNYDYIKIDTNPYDIEDGSSTYLVRAMAAIKNIHSYFGVPDFVYDDILHTRGIDGRQSYSDSNVSIHWRYHPDTGLEITYMLA